MTIQGDRNVSHVQFKCRTVPRVSVGSNMADNWKHTHAYRELFIGEQDVRGKDSILQMNLMKEQNVRTGNNQY